MLGEFSDDLAALKIPTKGGGTQAVRVILTISKEDKSLFEVANKSQSLIVMIGLVLSKLCQWYLD